MRESGRKVEVSWPTGWQSLALAETEKMDEFVRFMMSDMTHISYIIHHVTHVISNIVCNK